MEALLSLAFDNLSSYDGPKVRKGLRQVEGLLAQICLSSPNGKGPSRDSKASTPAPQSDDAASSPKKNRTLAELSGDPAFREFFKLQEGFEWNVALRLVGTLDRLLAKGADGQNDLLILSTLDLIQGVLLLHPPSKSLFEREVNMNVSKDTSGRRLRGSRASFFRYYIFFFFPGGGVVLSCVSGCQKYHLPRHPS